MRLVPAWKMWRIFNVPSLGLYLFFILTYALSSMMRIWLLGCHLHCGRLSFILMIFICRHILIHIIIILCTQWLGILGLKGRMCDQIWVVSLSLPHCLVDLITNILANQSIAVKYVLWWRWWIFIVATLHSFIWNRWIFYML